VKGVHVCLVHDVFGLVLVADDAARRPVHPFVVAAHQQFEHRRVSLQHLPDNLSVVLFCTYERNSRARRHGDLLLQYKEAAGSKR
jgi:hypothetical protein